MSDEKLGSRFAAVTQRLRENSALTSPDATEKKGFERFRRERTAEQDNTTTIPKVDIENSPIFKILSDSSLDPKEQAQKIAELLFFNENDLDSNPATIEENQKMVKHFLQVFSNHNREAMKLRRDNPLSELRAGTRDMLDEYHKLINNRSELKDKLLIIDEIISKHGGMEGLITALLNAKDKEIEKAQLDQAILEARARVEGLTGELKGLDTQSYALQTKVAENEGDPLLFFKGEKKRQLADDKRTRADVDAQIETKKKDLTEATASLEGKSAALSTFLTNEDYQLHQQILEVLDIGTGEFKQKLTDLADTTLNYIDYSEETMEGVRAQLELLLGKVKESHTATQNTSEQVSILLNAQGIAQKNNALKLQELQSEEVGEGVAAMKKEKKVRALNQHVRSLEIAHDSTASISGEMTKIQVDVTLFKDQLEEGLADASQQQLISTASATATGNGTLMRIETLATFVQGLIAQGAYKQEMQYNLGELAKEMERGLMARMARNESLKGIGDVVKEMAESMDERNDIVLQVAEEKYRLVERLIEQNERLEKSNENALAIESEVNKRVYGTTPEAAIDDKAPGGQSGAGAPSAPTLG